MRGRPGRRRRCPSQTPCPPCSPRRSGSWPRSGADDGPQVARSRSRRDPGDRQARGSHLARRGRPGATPGRHQAGRPRRDARPVRVGRPAGLPRPRDAGRGVPLGRPQGLPRHRLLRGLLVDGRPRGRARAVQRTGADRATPSRRRWPASAGTISQRPPAFSAIKVGGRRAYAMARAGETVVLAEREVTIHELTMLEWDGSDPDRPIAILDVVLLGRHVHPGARPRPRRDPGERRLPRRARAHGLGAVRARRTPSRSTRCATRPPPGRRASCRCSARSTPGLDAFPDVALTAEETLAVARGQFVSPAAGLPGPSEHYRLRGPDGALVAIATSSRRTAGTGQGVRVARRRSRAAGSLTPAMRVVDGVDALPPEAGPVFVVVGVFDGLHLGHRYLLEHLVAEAGRRGAAPTVITFDHHPDEVLTGSAPPLLIDPDERLAAARGRRRRGHGRPAFRRRPAPHRRTTRSSSGSATGSR